MLSSSLEDASFGLTNIQYFNAIVQVRCIPFPTNHVLMNHLQSISWLRLSSLVSSCQWGTSRKRMSRFPSKSCILSPRSSAHLKYKLASIFLAILMVYLIIASVLCGIATASQAEGGVVLLSIGVTYGGKVLMHSSSGRTLNVYRTLLERKLWPCSLCHEQPACVRSVASPNKFHTILVADSDICLHLEHVSESSYSRGNVQLTCACQLCILESQ